MLVKVDETTRRVAPYSFEVARLLRHVFTMCTWPSLSASPAGDGVRRKASTRRGNGARLGREVKVREMVRVSRRSGPDRVGELDGWSGRHAPRLGTEAAERYPAEPIMGAAVVLARRATRRSPTTPSGEVLALGTSLERRYEVRPDDGGVRRLNVRV